MHVRHCPNCRCDYRPEVVQCADCGAPLEDRAEEMDFRRPPATDPLQEEEEEQLDPPAGYEVIYTSGYIRDIEPLAEQLIGADVPFHLFERRTHARTLGFQILVQPADRERALRALSPLLPSEGGAPDTHAVETEFVEGRGYLRCPACSTDLSGAPAECPECGLPLATPERVCPDCKSPISPADERCGSCGTLLLE
jgi:hypothetical protein